MQLEGKWPDILRMLGVDGKLLSKKHGSCPKCGGKDRYRFTDFKLRGNWICGQCGGGDGYDLLEITLGYSFIQAKKRIEEICGNVTPIIRKEIPMDNRYLRTLWQESQFTVEGDIVSRYLASRHLKAPLRTLRTHPNCKTSLKEFFPAMLATVSDKNGKACMMHRTYLCETGKAAIENPREMTKGTAPEGACVRLGEAGKTLGIAEGIETALAASAIENIPVWAAISAPLFAKWIPPEGVEEVCIYADNDRNFTGQKAAYTLANRLADKFRVRVLVPLNPGEDWADVWLRVRDINRVDEKEKQA